MRKGLRERYLFYKKTGKLPYKNGRIDEELMYRERMKDVARENYEQWGYENPADAWQDAVNDPTYDYRGYYSDPLFQNTNYNSKTHWPDKYKTPQHETFSNESKYHGKQSDKNPYGLRGGMWIGDRFVPAAWQNPIQIPRGRITHAAFGLDDEEPTDAIQRRLTPLEYQRATWRTNALKDQERLAQALAANYAEVGPLQHVPQQLLEYYRKKDETAKWVALKKALELATDEMMLGLIDPIYIAPAGIVGGAIKGVKAAVLGTTKALKNYRLAKAIDRAVAENSAISAYNRNPAIMDTGSLWDYQTYLQQLFPESKIKDILWHGSTQKDLLRFSTKVIGSNTPIEGSTGMYLAPEKATAANYGSRGGVYPVKLNSKNPHITNQLFALPKNGVNVAKISPRVRNTVLRENDAVIAPKRGEIAFFDPNDALILGSNEDLQLFRAFVNTTPRGLLSNESLIAGEGNIKMINRRSDFDFEVVPGGNVSGILYSLLDRLLGKPKRDLKLFEEYTNNAKHPTAERIESAFNTRRQNYTGSWDTGEYIEPIPGTRESTKEFADNLLNELSKLHPSATKEELLNIFRTKYGNTYDDVLSAKGFIFRGKRISGHGKGYDKLERAQYTQSSDPVANAASKTHEANHTAFLYTDERMDKQIMQTLDTPEGKKVYFNEGAGVKTPNFNSGNPDEFYLDVDETTTYLSEAANLLGKTTPWTAQELQWLSKNLTLLNRLRHYNTYRTIFDRIVDYKKFAKALGKGLMYSTLSIPVLNK